VEFVFASVVAVCQLALAGLVFLSVSWPDRSPSWMLKVPLIWRLSALALCSVLAGAVIQLAGVAHRSH
jgi:hypothetical protein